MRAWPAAALAAVLAVILWSQPRAGGRRDRGAVDPGAGAAAAALRRATGIDPAAPVWGAPFRELAALYDGADPPLETFGVSAKLFSNGKAATARYYVALELPGSGGHLPRDAQRRAAARTAAALKAPPLVDAWLAVLAAEAPPPVYGFGVDADAGAAKLYVQNRDGAALPQLPAAAEAALPPVFSNGTREPPRTLSLEWRVGEATTALRQYAVGTTSDGTPRPVRDSFLAVGGGQLAEALEAAADAHAASIYDVAATGFFQADGPAPPARAERTKIGLAFERWPNVDALASIFEAYGVDATAAARWARKSAVAGHSITNMEVGRGAVALYSHPTRFDFFDGAAPALHAQPAAPRGVAAYAWPAPPAELMMRSETTVVRGSPSADATVAAAYAPFFGRGALARDALTVTPAAAAARHVEDLAARLGCVASGGCAELGHDGTGAPLADEVESAVLRVENLKGGFDATGTAYEQILAPFPLDAHTAHVYASARGRSALASHTDTTDVPAGAEINPSSREFLVEQRSHFLTG